LGLRDRQRAASDSPIACGVAAAARPALSFAVHLEKRAHGRAEFFPVFVSRGVVQISAYVDALLASLLPTGAVAALAYAQTLYTLPSACLECQSPRRNFRRCPVRLAQSPK